MSRLNNDNDIGYARRLELDHSACTTKNLWKIPLINGVPLGNGMFLPLVDDGKVGVFLDMMVVFEGVYPSMDAIFFKFYYHEDNNPCQLKVVTGWFAFHVMVQLPLRGALRLRYSSIFARSTGLKHAAALSTVVTPPAVTPEKSPGIISRLFGPKSCEASPSFTNRWAMVVPAFLTQMSIGMNLLVL